MKRLRSQVKSIVNNEASNTLATTKHRHSFENEQEIQNLRTSLLNWYDVNKRELQWRNLAKHSDSNIRAYSGIYFIIFSANF